MTLTARQKEITNAALTLIADGGIQNLTIRNLAKSIGVSEAAIYRHFSGKNDIVRALITSFDAAVQWNDKLRGWEAIRTFSTKRIHLILKNPELAHVFFSEEIFQDDVECREMIQNMLAEHKKALEKRLREAVEDGKLRTDVSFDSLPCLVYAPIRLLIKQWGMSRNSFDLKKRCGTLLDTLEVILQPQKL